MDPSKLKPLSLLYVEYIEGDRVGQLLAWTSMFPVFLFISMVTLVIFKRDMHTLCFTLGILVDEVVNKVLKNLIQEPRPTLGRSHIDTEYGMPSNHSQYMGFFAVYFILFIFIRCHHSVYALDNLWKYAVSVAVLCAASLTAYSRYYLGYHTAPQCWYGLLTGAVVACFWCGVVQLILTPLFPVVVSWRLSELLLLRDLTHIPHVTWFEYTSQRSEARSRHRRHLPGRKQS